MANSEDFATYQANREKRKEIHQLWRLGEDCWNELQYAKAEKFYQRAAALAEEINDLSLMLSTRTGLAHVQKMQGKLQEALGIFTWLIEVAYNPELSRGLDETDLIYMSFGFIEFVAIGSSLTEIQVVDLERVIDRGLDWLISIGKRDWSADLRYQRGVLWNQLGRTEAALAEIEAALALKRRSSNAYGRNLGDYRNSLSDLFERMGKLEEAERYLQEVLEDGKSNDSEKYKALFRLANLAMVRGEWAQAEIYARKSLDLAQQIESAGPIFDALNALGNVLARQEKIGVDGLTEINIQLWRYARQLGIKSKLYHIYQDMAGLRIYQARQGNPHRYIPKARRWLQWALSLAMQLDRQINSTAHQTEIRDKQIECESVLAGESAITSVQTEITSQD